MSPASPALPADSLPLNHRGNPSLVLLCTQIHLRGCQQTPKLQTNLDQNLLKLPPVATLHFLLKTRRPSLIVQSY